MGSSLQHFAVPLAYVASAAVLEILWGVVLWGMSRCEFYQRPRYRTLANALWFVVALTPGLIVPAEYPGVRLIAVMVTYGFWARPIEHAVRNEIPARFWQYIRDMIAITPIYEGQRTPSRHAPLVNRGPLRIAACVGLYAALLVICVMLATHTMDVPLVDTFFLMWGLLCLASLFAEMLVLPWRCLGLGAEEIFDEPYRASSLSDFWSRRWDRPVSRLLRRLIYEPAKPHVGPIIASLAAFAISGIAHEFFVDVVLRQFDGRMLLFFAIHGVVTVVSSGLIRRPVLSRVILWVSLILTGALFIGPLLETISRDPYLGAFVPIGWL